MMRRLLIANRGEIAIRIAHAARERGIVPLGIYSEADTHALHRRFMDESLCVGPAAAAESYLNVASILTAARELRRRHPPRLRLPVGAGRVRPGGPRCRPHLRRPVAGGDRRRREQDRRTPTRA